MQEAQLDDACQISAKEQENHMRMKLQKIHVIAGPVAALILGAGCSEKPHLPPVNPHPTEKIVLRIRTNMPPTPDMSKSTTTYIEVLYTPTDPGCGYVDYFAAIGGIYRRPQRWVKFVVHDGLVTIYRDYFEKRKKCPARISQAIIHITGPNGFPSGMNVNALVVDAHTRGVLHAICDFAEVVRRHICWNRGKVGAYRSVENDRFTMDVQRVETW